jgi:hypothetical protein
MSLDSPRRLGLRPSVDNNRRTGTGSSVPLIWASSGSPRPTVFSTSRAVDSLSITPPGGAIDSIRCAMPTW